MHKFIVFGALMIGNVCAAPVQITISLSGGTFATNGITDTGTGFSTSAATCTGTGCASLSSITGLNSLLAGFTVPSGSTTGSGSILTGSLFQSANLSGFMFTGAAASPPFNQNSSFTENVSATGVLGTTVPLSGTLALTWSGNSSIQARNATGSITLAGDVASVPEPSTALLLAIPIVGLVLRRRVNSTTT